MRPDQQTGTVVPCPFPGVGRGRIAKSRPLSVRLTVAALVVALLTLMPKVVLFLAEQVPEDRPIQSQTPS